MIPHNLLHTIALILSATAMIIFVSAAKTLKGNLKTSYVYTSLGILVAVTIHSLVEHLANSGIISNDNLIFTMPILVTIGSVFFIVGGYLIIKRK